MKPPADIDVRTLGDFVSGRSETVRRLRGQLDVPTLCANCNSTILGQNYDPELARFSNSVSQWARAAFDQGLTLSNRFTVSCRPLRIVKAVVGHLLASDPRNRRRTGPSDAPTIVTMRNFFLDKHAQVPPGMHLFCWIYPSDLVVICRAVAIVYPDRTPFLFDVIKFFPLAFMIAFSRPSDRSLPRFEIPSGTTLDSVVDVPLTLERCPRTDFPEVVGDNDMMLIDDKMTIVAQPRRRSRPG